MDKHPKYPNIVVGCGFSGKKILKPCFVIKSSEGIIRICCDISDTKINDLNDLFSNKYNCNLVFHKGCNDFDVNVMNPVGMHYDNGHQDKYEGSLLTTIL